MTKMTSEKEGASVPERRNRGELETIVLRILWSAPEPLSARDIMSRFPDQQAVPALTTMLTVLDRLDKKHTVLRTPSATGGWQFAAATSEPTHTAEAMSTALLSSSDRSAALLRFAGTLTEKDVATLRDALGHSN